MTITQTSTKAHLNQKYPLPFFDISQARMPKTIHDIYKWCIYYYISTPLIPAVIDKLSMYPITKPIITDTDKKSEAKWKKILIDDLNIQTRLVELSLDWCLYGNAFAAVYVAPIRFFKCKECSKVTPMHGSDWSVSFKNKKVVFTHYCDVCKKVTSTDIMEQINKDTSKFNIIRYNPMDIRTVEDVATGKLKYLWEIPEQYRSAILSGNHPDLIREAPFEILKAIASGRPMVLDRQNLFHMKRPNPSSNYGGLGLPLVVHALKWTYYLQVLQKAQEAVAEDKLNPLDILFPEPSGAGTGPVSLDIGLSKFKKIIQEGISRKAKDPNHKIVSPVPVGTSRVGGDGRAMLLAAEIDWVSKQIIASMGVPVEFVFGGLTWTGSSITLRMLENTFTGMRDQADRFLNFCVSKIYKVIGGSKPEVRLSELKMADDIQRQNLLMQLEASKKISTTTLLEEFGFNQRKENMLKKDEYHMFMADMIKDTIANATAQGEASIVSNNYMMRSQIIQQQQSDIMNQQGEAQSQPQVDPNTGLPIDPNTGLPIDPNTGQLYDPQTGQPLTPEQAQQAEYMAQQNQLAQQPEGPQSSEGNTEGPGSAVDNAIYSQQEQAYDQQNAEAKQAGSYDNAPENIKQLVTMWANRLLQMDRFSQQQVLSYLSKERPDITSMIQQKMQAG